MAFDFEKIKDSLIVAGKEVESKAKEVSAIAKIKVDIRDKEIFLEKQYALLGKAFYNAHKDEDVEENVYFPSIVEAEEEIVRLKNELLAAQGAFVCPSCGSKQPAGNGFCSDCGTALK